MYDPSQGLQDPTSGLADPMQFQNLQTQQTDLQRQIAMAALLRKQAGAPGSMPEMPQGNMVSGHYVAPAWTQMLAAVANPLMQQSSAKAAEDVAQGSQHALEQSIAAAKQKWLDNMPQTTPATPPSGPQVDQNIPAQGPPAPNGAPPAQVAMGPGTPGTPAVLPSALQRAQFLAQGMNIPGNDANVALMGKTLGEEVTREDTQQARKDAAAAQQQSNLIVKQVELQKEAMANQRMLEQHTLDNQTRMDLQAQQASLQRDLHAMDNETRRYDAQVRAQQQSAAYKPLPNVIHTDLAKQEDATSGIMRLAQSFDPVFAGLGTTVKNLNAKYNPLSSDPTMQAGSQWWQDYAKTYSLEEAKRIFGSAFTTSEQARWNAADIAPDMKPETIQQNLAKRAAIVQNMYANNVDRYEKGGYPQIRAVFDPANVRGIANTGPSPTLQGQQTTPAPTGPAFVPGGQRALPQAIAAQKPAQQPTPQQGPVQVKDEATYNALPSGTQYVGPDGQLRVKK